MILLALAAAALNCPPGTKQARQHGKPTCVKVVAPKPDPWVIAAPLRTYAAPAKWVWRNSYPAAPINTTIERVSAVCKETCIWAGRASTSTVIRDAELTRAAPSQPDEIDAGIKVGGSKGGVATAGVLIERVYSHGWKQNTAPGKYANGDGIVVNRGVVDVTVRYARLDDNADSGLDSKANLTTLDNVSASGNGHYGFRFWVVANATTLTCTDNAWGCIKAEDGARVTIDKLVMVGAEELVTTKKGAIVEVKACDLSRWTGKAPTVGQGIVKLGAGCTR